MNKRDDFIFVKRCKKDNTNKRRLKDMDDELYLNLYEKHPEKGFTYFFSESNTTRCVCVCIATKAGSISKILCFLWD